MKPKQILIVSKSFFPENTPRGFRTTELTKQFARMGHQVTVITPRNSRWHDDFEKEHGVKIKDLGQPKWKPITVGTGFMRLFRRIWVRLASLLIIYPDIELMFMVRRALKKETNRYDMLISIAAPHTVHWGTAWAIRKNKPIADRWIADCGDPFMGGENDTFKRLFYFKYLEKWFCRKADFITVPIEKSIIAYYPEFRSKIRVIPQGFRFEDVEIVAQQAKNKIPVFAYAGTLIPKIRDPHEFFEFICKTDLEYKFVVYTNNPDHVNKYRDQSAGRIEIRPFIPRLQLLSELQQMDFMVNFENRGPKQSPSKLIDYAIIKKPILSVKTFGFSPEAFLEFLKGDYEKQFKIEDPDQYRIERICTNFINLV